MELTFDIKQDSLVTSTGAMDLNRPAICFHQTYNLLLRIKNGSTNMNLSHVSTWRAAVDKDDLSTTLAMCRTLDEDIDASQASDGLLQIKVNTNTETFQKAVKGKSCGIYCHFELWGYDGNGCQTFYLSFPAKAYSVTDPYGGIVPSAPVNGTMEVTQLWALMRKYLPIRLAACSSLGMTTTGNGFSWVDPDDVVLNGATLAFWCKTVLVRKEGNCYPDSPLDGTVLTTTSKTLANKNYYRDHTFIDTTAVSGTTYKYKLFSQTDADAWNCLAGNEFTGSTGLSWYQVQQYVRAGRGAELFPVGTTFVVNHGDFYHTDGTGLYFRVVGHDQVPCADESLTHSMALECTECIAQLPFDAVELQYALTADTTYQSGKTYYSLSGTTYTAMVAGTDYNVGDTVPVATVYEKNYGVRNTYGNNDWADSNIRQWLNSSGNAGAWFTKQNIWDLCASDLQNRDGFCKNIDQEFLAVLQQAKNACLHEDSGVYTNTNDKIFLLSCSQFFGVPTYQFDEGVRLTYYANGGSAVKPVINGSAVIYVTRSYSSYPGRQGSAILLVNSNGTYFRDTKTVNNTYGIAPCCIIA